MHVAAIDILILVIYAAFVLGIGFLLRKQMVGTPEFLLAGRSMPAWVAGLAFLSANLGAQEMIGMAASGAKYGMLPRYTTGASRGCVFLTRIETCTAASTRRDRRATHTSRRTS